MTYERMRNGWLGLTAAVILAGCSEGLPPEPSEGGARQRAATVSVTQALTPQLAAILRADGTLPIASEHQVGSEITPSRATELAVAFLREYGKYDRSVMEKVLGFQLRFDDLVPSERVFFAHSPYGEIDPRYSKPTAKAFGPYYLVSLMQDGVPAISIAVSAKASDLGMKGGKIVAPRRRGNEFHWLAIPQHVEFPITPERAVRIVSAETGALIASMPTLVAAIATREYPQYSRGRMILNKPVTVTLVDGSFALTDTVYVDWNGRLLVRAARDQQADVARLRLAAGRADSEDVRLPTRPDFARHLTLVRDVDRSQP